MTFYFYVTAIPFYRLDELYASIQDPPSRRRGRQCLYSHHSTRSFTAFFPAIFAHSDRPPRNRPQERQIGAGATSRAATAESTLVGATMAVAAALDDHSRRRRRPRTRRRPICRLGGVAVRRRLGLLSRSSSAVVAACRARRTRRQSRRASAAGRARPRRLGRAAVAPGSGRRVVIDPTGKVNLV